MSHTDSVKRFSRPQLNVGYFMFRWISPILDPVKMAFSIPGYIKYLHDIGAYRRTAGAEPIRVIDTYPCLSDGHPVHPYDSHYFYQDLWAAKRISCARPVRHIDVGSRLDFVAFLTTLTDVEAVDLRRLDVNVDGLKCTQGDVLELPYGTSSVGSLSCLHVAEHVGLGRYGDKLDPNGTKKACNELARILGPSGSLYFSVPVGVPRLCFNAHRIHSPEQIASYFESLKLVEFSAVSDDGKYVENADLRTVAKSDYACGMFRFTKV